MLNPQPSRALSIFERTLTKYTGREPHPPISEHRKTPLPLVAAQNPQAATVGSVALRLGRLSGSVFRFILATRRTTPPFDGLHPGWRTPSTPAAAARQTLKRHNGLFNLLPFLT